MATKNTGPDMSRNMELAGKTVSTGGMNVTYDSNGYATKSWNPNHSNYAGTTKSLYAQDKDAALRGEAWTEPSREGLIEWGDGTGMGNVSGSGDTRAARSTGGTGSAYDGSYGSGYSSAYSAYYDALKAANDAAVQRAIGELTARKTAVNESYDDYARQAYRDKMTAERDIDQYLGARGITGGAAESTILGLNTSYADELRQIEQSRRETLGALDRAISDARLTGDLNNAQAAAEAAKEQAALYAQEAKERKAAEAAQRQSALAETQSQQSWARTLAGQMLAAGRMPDDATLAAAGLTRAQAELLLPEVKAEEVPAYTPTFTVAQVQAEINRALKYGTSLPESVLRDYEYYYGVPYGGGNTPSYSASSGGSSTVGYNNSGYSTAEVKALQQWYRSQGYDIAADGYWGPASQRVTGMSDAKKAMAFMDKTIANSKNAGIPQSLIDEINRDAEGGMSPQNLYNKIIGWINSGKITKAQGNWLAESFGY